MLSERATTILPEASANRPVPPVMVWVSVIVAVGNAMTACPADVVKILSPLAAVHMAVPLPIPVVVSTVKSEVSLNRPNCVASPVPTSCRRAPVVSVASKVPRKGNSEPPLASVTAAPTNRARWCVGALGASAHAAANTQKPNTTYRIVWPLSGDDRDVLELVGGLTNLATLRLFGA